MKDLLDKIFPTLSDELIIVISLIIGLLVTASLILFLVKKIFPKTKTGERIAGGLLVVGIVAASSFAPWLILHLAYGFRTWLGVALESFMCYQLLAARSLRDESKKV